MKRVVSFSDVSLTEVREVYHHYPPNFFYTKCDEIRWVRCYYLLASLCAGSCHTNQLTYHACIRSVVPNRFRRELDECRSTPISSSSSLPKSWLSVSSLHKLLQETSLSMVFMAVIIVGLTTFVLIAACLPLLMGITYVHYAFLSSDDAAVDSSILHVTTNDR